MKVLFLDIDGVVNKGRRFRVGFDWADAKCVDFINEVIRKTGAKIVISSSWRIGSTLEELSDHFKNKFRIDGEFIGLTPAIDLEMEGMDHKVSAPRAMEVRDWLNDHPEVTSFAVIDDMDIFVGSEEEAVVEDAEIKQCFVKLDFFGGMTHDAKVKLIKILSGLHKVTLPSQGK